MALFSWIIRCIIVVSLRTNTADSTASSNDTGVNGNGCSCTYDGKLFNIEPLRDIDRPRCTAHSKTYIGYRYAYNPCTPFKEGLPNPRKKNDCQEDVAVCWWAKDDPNSYTTIGTQSSVKCGIDELGNPQLEYKSRLGDRRKSTVKLNCDQSRETKDEVLFEVLDEDNWIFRLSHKCACADACPLAPTDSSASQIDGILAPMAYAAAGVILLIPIAFVFWRWRKRRREAEERARLLDQPNNRFDPPNDIDAQRNDLPNLQNNGGRNSANLSQPVPLSLSCSDITEPAKDKYGNNRVKPQSV